MPIYDYRCSSCDTQKDVMQKFSDAPLTTCPACGKETFSKQISVVGFQLKGSGYYATDFKNKPKAEPACAPCAAAGSCPVAQGTA